MVINQSVEVLQNIQNLKQNMKQWHCCLWDSYPTPWKNEASLSNTGQRMTVNNDEQQYRTIKSVISVPSMTKCETS